MHVRNDGIWWVVSVGGEDEIKNDNKSPTERIQCGVKQMKKEPGVKLRSWTPMAKWEGTGAARVHTERFVRWYGSSPFGEEGGAHV